MKTKTDADGTDIMSENQQMFDELDKKLKKLEEQIQPAEKETIIVEKKMEPEDNFKKQLIERLKSESIVEVYQKKDGSFIIASVPEKEGLLVISFCVIAVLVVLLITNVAGLW